MVYLALLRGINVGGKSPVNMATLRACFEQLGFTNVSTYINSGNVVFCSDETDAHALATRIETALAAQFSFSIKVLLRDLATIKALVADLPASWTNDAVSRCDIMFLWPSVDQPAVVEEFPAQPELETVRYSSGAVVWHIERSHVRKSRMPRIIGSKLYAHITIRNVNTVRKLLSLMEAAHDLDN